MRHSSDEPFASAYEDDHPIPPILSLSDELSEEIAFDHHIPPILRLPDELLDKVAFHLLATPCELSSHVEPRTGTDSTVAQPTPKTSFP